MLTGPPPKFHGTRDILVISALDFVRWESCPCSGVMSGAAGTPMGAGPYAEP
jgi:hypothetical protein